MAKRIFLIVLDSFGIGAEPDAPAFGDAGTNTLGAIAGHPNFKWDQLARLGMFNLDGVTCGTKLDAPVGCYARLREASAGKDTTIGHWEIAGLLSPHCQLSRMDSRKKFWMSLPPAPGIRYCATSLTPAPKSSKTMVRNI